MKNLVLIFVAIIPLHCPSFAQVNHPKKKVHVVARHDKPVARDRIKSQKIATQPDKKPENVLNKAVNKGLKKGTGLYIKNAWDAIY